MTARAVRRAAADCRAARRRRRRSAPRLSPARRRGRRAPARSRRPARRAGWSGPRASGAPTCSSRFSTTSGARPSDGSSSSSSSGLPIRVRPMVSICCSPPERNPPCRFGELAQLREQARTRASTFQRPGRPAARAATSRFSQHRQLGEDAAVLRHEADAGARDAERRPARRCPALPDDAARARRRQAHDRAHGRGLADAVAAEQADAFARAPPRARCRTARATSRRRRGCRGRRAGSMPPPEIDAPHLRGRRAPRAGVPSAISRP